VDRVFPCHVSNLIDMIQSFQRPEGWGNSLPSPPHSISATAVEEKPAPIFWDPATSPDVVALAPFFPFGSDKIDYTKPFRSVRVIVGID